MHREVWHTHLIRGWSATAALLAVWAAPCISGSAGADAPRAVWFWDEHCGASALLVELRLDERLLYQAVVPICRRAPSQGPQVLRKRTVSFSATPPRAIEWRGYHDREDVAEHGARLAIEIGQDGASGTALMLTVTASDPGSERIYMQDVLIAEAEKDSATDLAPGLTLSTHPSHLSPHERCCGRQSQ